jgi:parallel beta-helix repeat protein
MDLAKLVSLFFLHLFCSTVFCQTIALRDSVYVDPVNGKDWYPGTLVQAVKSLWSANSKAAAGATVFMKGGLYGPQMISTQNTPVRGNAPITVKPLSAQETVIIDGTNQTITSAGLLSLYVPNYIIKNLTIRNVTCTQYTTPALEKPGVYIGGSTITLQECIVENTCREAITAKGNNIVLSGNTIKNAAMINACVTTTPNAFCYFSTAENKWHCGGWPPAVLIGKTDNSGSPSQHIIVERNTVYNSWGEGIMLANCIDANVRDNVVYDNFTVCLSLLKSRKIRVYNNVFNITNDAYNRPDYESRRAVGIHLANELAFSANEVPVGDILIYNNLILGCSVGLNFWLDNAADSSKNAYDRIRFFHNVIYKPTRKAVSMDQHYAYTLSKRGHVFKNNIIQESDLSTSAIGNPQEWVISNNTWTNFLPSFALDTKNFVADPLFHNPEQAPAPYVPATAFRVLYTSPCRKNGAYVQEVTSDFWNTPRASTPTIGLHELTFPNPGKGIISDESVKNDHDPYLFPNPVQRNQPVYITGNKEAYTLEISSVSGQQVYRQSVLKEQARAITPNLPEGLYVVKISTAEVVHLQRLIIVE